MERHEKLQSGEPSLGRDLKAESLECGTEILSTQPGRLLNAFRILQIRVYSFVASLRMSKT
jgi:hypothetical protein